MNDGLKLYGTIKNVTRDEILLTNVLIAAPEVNRVLLNSLTISRNDIRYVVGTDNLAFLDILLQVEAEAAAFENNHAGERIQNCRERG